MPTKALFAAFMLLIVVSVAAFLVLTVEKLMNSNMRHRRPVAGGNNSNDAAHDETSVALKKETERIVANIVEHLKECKETDLESFTNATRRLESVLRKPSS